MRGSRQSSSWDSCNVLHVLADEKRLWRFTGSNGEATLSAAVDLPPDQAFPARGITKGWRNLWHRQLNLAWVPPEHAFLRVAHLPRCDPAELDGMVELQLEKLSPLPVHQVVWAYQSLAHPDPAQQTIVVIVVGRSDVEGYLGELEQTGYLPDRLELSWLNWVAANRPETDGTWMYVATRPKESLSIVAWWYDGTLQNLNLLRLPEGDDGPVALAEHMTRLAWAGETEGWLATQPIWHLITEPALEESWAPALESRLGDQVTRHPAPALDALATLAAQRSRRNEGMADLMPDENRGRYQQQFIDRLWMRGLGTAIVVYLCLVLVYFGLLRYFEFEQTRLERQTVRLAGAYTNALALQQRIRILEEQQGLKHAALDCLQVASELLPPELTLTSFIFDGNQSSLRLAGTVALEDQTMVTEFNADIRKASIDGIPLFDRENVEAAKFTGLPGKTQNYRWDFKAQLNTAPRP